MIPFNVLSFIQVRKHRLKVYMKINGVFAREIYDSLGMPTIQCQLIMENGIAVCSSVPSGSSPSSFEACELRDGGRRLFGKGVLSAIKNIEDIISPQIIGKEVDAIEIDKIMIELDGTPHKYNLGSNAMLAVSMAVYRAHAFCLRMELFEFIYHLLGNTDFAMPQPLFTVMGNEGIGQKCAIQKFMIMPIGMSNFRVSLESGIIFFQEFKDMLQNQGIHDVKKTDAIGFSLDEKVLDILNKTIEVMQKKYGYYYAIALNMGANDYYDDFKYGYHVNGTFLTSSELIDYYEKLTTDYDIFSIADGLSEVDYQGWAELTVRLKSKIKVVGDKIFCTNVSRVARGIGESLATSVMIKPSQVGTITETLQVMQLCKEMNMGTIVSHRCAETEDTFIADLAIGAGAEEIEFGSLNRGELIAKYNRLLYIEDKLSLNY